MHHPLNIKITVNNVLSIEIIFQLSLVVTQRTSPNFLTL